MNRKRFRFYPEVIFSLAIIVCMAAASFLIAADANGRKDIYLDGESVWSVYFLDTCQSSTPKWKHLETFSLYQDQGNIDYKLLLDRFGAKIGYWGTNVNVHGIPELRIDLFDAVGASFIFIDGSSVLEGNGKIISDCGIPYMFTKFILVKEAGKCRAAEEN